MASSEDPDQTAPLFINLHLQDFKKDMKKYFLEFQLVQGATFPDYQHAPSKFNLCWASGLLIISNTVSLSALK